MSPVVLVVLIAWALLSVLFLTGTLLAARSIDRSVAVIKPNVIQIGDEGAFIRQAKTIADATVKIRAAAAPLSGHLATTLTTAHKGIEPKLDSILGKVGQINEVAGSINGTVLQIGSTVDSIFSSADSINGHVKSIGRSVDVIDQDTKQINASARGILSSGNGILDRVNSIDRAVAKIIDLATSADATLSSVAKDFVGIDANVGQEGRGGTFGRHITGHTNSVDCALAVSGKGCKK